jgi:hypothetical protein
MIKRYCYLFVVAIFSLLTTTSTMASGTSGAKVSECPPVYQPPCTCPYGIEVSYTVAYGPSNEYLIYDFFGTPQYLYYADNFCNDTSCTYTHEWPQYTDNLLYMTHQVAGEEPLHHNYFRCRPAPPPSDDGGGGGGGGGGGHNGECFENLRDCEDVCGGTCERRISCEMGASGTKCFE